MQVNSGYFCSLSTAPQFLSWLRGFSASIYDDLTTHLKQSKSCSSNTQKMMKILDSIIKEPDGEKKLVIFLNASFPHVLSTPKAAMRVDDVFGHYDPSLLTVPRRRVFDNEFAAREFLADKPVGEYVIVGSKVYVEYLPSDLVGLMPSIPAGNWLVREYRKRKV